MIVWNRLFAVLFVLHVVKSIHGDDIILRIAPSEQATILGTIEADAPEIKSANSVSEHEFTEHGWKWFDHNLQINGYLPAEDVSKNFELISQSSLYVEPDSRSQVLALIQPTDQFEIIRSGENWFYLRLHKALPVFFQEATFADPPRQPEASATFFKPQIDPNADLGKLDPSELAPENVIWSKALKDPSSPSVTNKAPDPSTSIIVGASQTQASELPRNPSLNANVPPSALTGILVREISDTGPRYPVRLKSSATHSNIYVDMSQVFISDLRPFLDQHVEITGEVRPLVPGSRDQIIQARTLRIIE